MNTCQDVRKSTPGTHREKGNRTWGLMGLREAPLYHAANRGKGDALTAWNGLLDRVGGLLTEEDA